MSKLSISIVLYHDNRNDLKKTIYSVLNSKINLIVKLQINYKITYKRFVTYTALLINKLYFYGLNKKDRF